MDVAFQALRGEDRATIFRLKHRVRDLEEEVAELRAELQESKKKGAVWVERVGSTPELDALITRLANHTN